jgi:hypothetical protein
MEHSDCNVHYNRMKLRIACCFVCFMIASCVCMETRDRRRSISLDLECEPSCCNPSLGLTIKAKACKVVGQKGSQGVTFHVPESAKNVRE